MKVYFMSEKMLKDLNKDLKELCKIQRKIFLDLKLLEKFSVKKRRNKKYLEQDILCFSWVLEQRKKDEIHFLKSLLQDKTMKKLSKARRQDTGRRTISDMYDRQIKKRLKIVEEYD